MKVYTKSVWQWQPDGSPKLIESESFDYEGPVIECKSSPSPPPAPDYIGAAQAQGTANLQTALAQGVINNPNVNNPYGSQTVTWSPPDANGVSQPTINQQLSPAGQQQLAAYQALQTGASNLGQQALANAHNALGSSITPMPITGQIGSNPSYVSNVPAPQLQTSFGAGIPPPQYTAAPWQGAQGSQQPVYQPQQPVQQMAPQQLQQLHEAYRNIGGTNDQTRQSTRPQLSPARLRSLAMLSDK